jgi:hypothetical protein
MVLEPTEVPRDLPKNIAGQSSTPFAFVKTPILFVLYDVPSITKLGVTPEDTRDDVVPIKNR